MPLVLRRVATSWITPCCVLAALLQARPAQAQGERAHTQVVLGGGVSFAGGSPPTSAGAGLAGHAGLRHQREDLVFSVWAAMHHGGSAPATVPGGLRDSFDELALMAGYAVHRSGNSQVVLSAGIASVSGERVGTGPAPFFGQANVPFKTRIGFPLQMTLSAPGGGSGFGLTAHANLNPEEVFGAVMVTYLIGLGRPR